MIVSSTSKRNEKKEQILALKEEILELRKRGLSLSQIVEYLKKAHKLKTTPTYLKKVIPELSSKSEYVYSLLNTMSDEQIVDVLVRLGRSRVENIFRIYRLKQQTGM
jgi:DNA-binding transcriptional MerR regulator